jgi:hypothetical protein
MDNPKILLKDILKIKKDFEKQGMNLPPGLAGIYGEILVYQKLKKFFKTSEYEIIFYSQQKNADIQLIKKGKKINIEVKTSRLKDEGFGKWYGVALNIKKCRVPEHSNRYYIHSKKGKIVGDFCYFNYVIFVTLNENFSTPKFYIIPRDFIEKNKKLLINTHKRFSSGTHRLILSNNGKMPKVDQTQKKLIRKTEFFRNKWNLIQKDK